jgi:hypothetical protein
MADIGNPPHESGPEARVARLEADVSEIRAILNRLAPRIDEMYDFLTARLSELATKVEVIGLRAETKTQIADLRTEIADLRTETKAEIADLRLEIVQRPTRRQSVFDILAVVGLIGAILTIATRFTH